MSDNDFLELVQRMNELIRRSSTGTPSEFARKLKISESTLYRYLSNLRNDLDAPIAYCRYRRSYYYQRQGNILIGFYKLSQNEAKKVRGGHSSINSRYFLPYH